MLEFNPPPGAGGVGPPSAPSPAGSMLSFLNLNMDTASRNSAFVLGNPPLAALHSMTEMKSAMFQHYPGAQGLKGSPLGGLPTAQTLAATTSSSATPHGIDHILSRPAPTTLGLPRFNVTSAAGMYLNPATFGKQPTLADLTTRSALYWPGLQGLVNNPMAWRDRLSTGKSWKTFY